MAGNTPNVNPIEPEIIIVDNVVVRPTVVRKLKYLMKNGFVTINKKKLYSFNIKNKKNYKKSTEIQDQNINSLLYFLLRSFNQMNIS